MTERDNRKVMDDAPCPMSLPAPPGRSAPPRLPLELIIQIATLVAESPQTDGLSCLAALALASRSFARAVAPCLARAAVYYDADRYLAWPTPTTPTTTTTALTIAALDDAQVAALVMGFARRLPQEEEEEEARNKNGYQEYGAGPVILFACRAGRADLVQELVKAASKINTSREGSRTTGTRRIARVGAENGGTSPPPPQTPFLSPQSYLGAHFWVPFTCANHMPRVWRRLEGDPTDSKKTRGDGGCHDEMEGLLGKTTPLHVAAQYGQLEVVEVILAQMMMRASTSTSTSTSRSTSSWSRALDMPATLACTCPSAHMAAVAESSPDPLDWPWATPVVVALSHGHEAVARRLIVAGAAWDHAPHWVGTSGISVTHVAAAQRMAGMLEWLGGLQKQQKQHKQWVDWPDANGRFMLHHICDANMDGILHSSMHSSSRISIMDSNNANLSRLLQAISRLGAFSRPSTRLLQTHIDRARVRASSLSSSITALFLKSLADMEKDQMGELAARYMTGGDDDMLQPGADKYAMEMGLVQVARQMERAGLGSNLQA